MKRILEHLVLILIALAAALSDADAQSLPPVSLVAQYDMVTITGGTTLVDLSGSGNNGTLHGTTPGSQGIALNGSSDYISIPALTGNKNYTVVVCAQATNPGAEGYLWAENNSAANSGAALTNQRGYFLSTGVNTTNWTISLWACDYITRSESGLSAGSLAANISQMLNLSNPATVTTTVGSLGAQVFSGTPRSFFAGTLGYAVIYTRPLSIQDLVQAYAFMRNALAARSAYMQDLVAPLYPGRVWQRQGPVFTPTSAQGGSAGNITAVGYTTTDCALISNPCFQVWYDNGSAGYYAESAKGFQPWTAQAVSSFASCVQNDVGKVTGFSFQYISLSSCAGAIGPKTAFTSSSPLFTSSASHSNVLPTASWATGYANAAITQPVINGTVYVMSDNGSNKCGMFTTTVAAFPTFTPVSANPISGTALCDGPWIWQNPNTNIWYMWDYLGSPGSFQRLQAVNPNSIWQWSSPGTTPPTLGGLMTFVPDAPDESSQITDPQMIQPPPGVCPIAPVCTYMFYSTTDNSGLFVLKLAIAPMPLTSLVQTGEGEASSQP